jgi:hypothetical protein
MTTARLRLPRYVSYSGLFPIDFFFLYNVPELLNYNSGNEFLVAMISHQRYRIEQNIYVLPQNISHDFVQEIRTRA